MGSQKTDYMQWMKSQQKIILADNILLPLETFGEDER